MVGGCTCSCRIWRRCPCGVGGFVVRVVCGEYVRTEGSTGEYLGVPVSVVVLVVLEILGVTSIAEDVVGGVDWRHVDVLTDSEVVVGR